MLSPISKVAIGWTAFVSTHMVMSHPPNRKKLIEKLGKEKFMGLYSLVSFATFIPMTVIYFKSGRNATLQKKSLFIPSNWMKSMGSLFNLCGVLTASQALVSPSPSGIATAKDIPITTIEDKDAIKKDDQVETRGLVRITRHGMFMAFALFGLGQSLRSGRLLDLVYWFPFPVFWVIGSMHQDYRKKSEMPAEYFEKTSLLPFQAILEGRNSISKAFEEMSLSSAVAFLLFAALFKYLPPHFRKFRSK